MKRTERIRMIRSRMALNDETQDSLAKRLGVSQSLVNGVIRGHKASPRVYAALHRLGVPDEYLRTNALSAEAKDNRETLHKAGITMTALAQRAGVSRQVATDTVDGKARNKKVLEQLALIKENVCPPSP